MALRVTPVCSGGVPRYVGAPLSEGLNHNRALLVEDPQQAAFLTPAAWLQEPGGGFEAVYVFGKQITPDTGYDVQAVYGTVQCPRLSAPVRMRTGAWGDVAGPVDPETGRWGLPDGVAAIGDALAAIDSFRGAPDPPFYRADVNAYACGTSFTGPTHWLVGILDVVQIVDVFRGVSYGRCVDGFLCCPLPCQTSGAPGPQNPYYFTGRRLDLDLRDTDPASAAFGHPRLALYHYRARAYDALHGRFLQRDPVGYADGMNLYEAFRSNPLSWLDPEGLKNLQAYHADAAVHGTLAADFWDWLGAYDVTVPAATYDPSGFEQDVDAAIAELKKRRQMIKQLGVGLEEGLKIIGIFSQGAELAIVIDDIGEHGLSATQIASLLPLVGHKQFKVLQKCGRVLVRSRGGAKRFLGAIKPAKVLRAELRGVTKGDLEMHHLIEKRFMLRLQIRDPDEVEAVLIPVLQHRGIKPRDIDAAIDAHLHKSLTQMFREAIPYRKPGDMKCYEQFTAQQIYEAHRNVYERFGISQVMEKINHWFEAAGASVQR